MKFRTIKNRQQRIEIALTLFIIVIFTLSAEQIGVFSFSRTGDSADFRYVFSSTISMAVSGLGMILLLLVRLRTTERSAAEKKRIMDLLMPRVAAMEAAMDGIAITDADGKIRYVNMAFASLNGYGMPDELKGQPWEILYGETERERFQSEVFTELLYRWHWQGHVTGLRKDGTTYHQDVSMTALDDGGKVWVVHDNSQTIEYLDLAKRRLAAIEAAGDGIGIVDADGNLTYLNQALMHLHGLDEADFDQYIGQSWENLYNYQGRADIKGKVMPILQQEGRWQGEAAFRRKDGELVIAEMSLTLLDDGGFVGTARDITDRKKAEKEKEDLQSQFFQAQKMEAVGRLAGGIAHDFNNILASISGYSEFLMEDLDRDSQSHYFASQIMSGCLQAQALVDQILSFSRRESEKSAVDLIQSLRGTEAILRPTVPAGIELDIRAGVPEALINGNATQVSQTIMNLCVNAIDAMENGRGRLTIAMDVAKGEDSCRLEMLAAEPLPPDAPLPVRLYDDKDGGTVLELGMLGDSHSYARVLIGDTGCGMPRSVMEHIFEPFFTTKPVDQGTGLGLSSVHGIMTAHGGALIVRSQPGKGTSFTLFFPLLQEQEEDKEDAGKDDAVLQQGSGRILVVEDDERVREIVTSMLGRLGYETAACRDGGEAIDVLREHPGRYDLVLSDYNMPRMTGLELAQEIAQDFPAMPVIILSGYSNRRLQSIISQAPNIKAVLRKPVRRDQLSDHLHKALQKAG